MRLHRFYVAPDTVGLKHDFWLHDTNLVHQWHKVLRFREGQELILFDGVAEDRLYKLKEINDNEAHLVYVTDFHRQLPLRELYLLWALLKKDKNDWIIQKGTELGVSHFIPLLAARSEKTGFNLERARKITIEATEQCGRSDIPTLREPMNVQTALAETKNKALVYVCDKDVTAADLIDNSQPAAVLIGPEGGWSETEKQLFKDNNIKPLNLHNFTLRAETAAIAACLKLLQ